MNHPNLLRLTRWCARWAGGVLVLATLMLAVGSFAGPGKGGMVLSAGTLTPKPPPLAPAAVTDLHVMPISDSAVVLTWTEVRSSTTGIPRYVVRYGPFESYSWATSQDVLTGGCGAPIVGSNAAGGRSHACVLSGMAPHHLYYFQVAAYTGTLNTTAVFSPLSNKDSTTLMERVGPMLVWRPILASAPFPVSSAWISAYPDTFPIRGAWNYGDYQLTAFGPNNAVTARGYLLVVSP